MKVRKKKGKKDKNEKKKKKKKGGEEDTNAWIIRTFKERGEERMSSKKEHILLYITLFLYHG